MRKCILTIYLLFAFFQFESIAQITIPSKAEVVNVTYVLDRDRVYIKYDIINAKKSDLFDISVKIFNSKGEEILKPNIKGNVETVSPGIKNSLVWYPGNYLKEIDDNFDIEVYAELLNPKIIKSLKKWDPYIYSTLYPGYGTFRMSNKKIHLAKGLVSYGFVGASVFNGLKSRSYYDDYLSSMDINERNEFYKKSDDKRKLANIYAISAATVWLLEYANIYLAKNKVLKSKMELGMQIDSFSNLPMVSLNFKL
ncbi:MAG: hypothetical protein KOO66_01745 [Bacteroidales bacterium]|nr:hypothetical protein [Bacteroidales bacterium]